jgi:hypothetical protein
LLRYSEPDRPLVRAAAFDSTPGAWARGAVVTPTLPVPDPGGVRLAIVDDFVDGTDPDLAGHTSYLNATSSSRVLGPHGTEVASVAGGSLNGTGVEGVFPGLPIVSYGMPPDITCSEAADGIERAAAARARVINLSFGGPDCFDVFVAVQDAYASGSLVVASAGNDFLDGNPVVFPAAYPHVLSVAAVDQDLRWAPFSNANAGVDIAAPGVAVPVSLPAVFDTTDGAQDGVSVVDGTSFAAPMVAGAAAWVAARRPSLANGQIADVLRDGARDVERRGYDSFTGFGLLDLAASLADPTPPLDPLEPNDGITFVDGTAFGRPDPRIWSGTGRRTIRASVDVVEDPVDVYRIRLPGKAAAAIYLRSANDPDLTVFSGRARTIADDDEVIDVSRRPAGRTDIVRLVNTAGDPRSAYVAVDVDRASDGSLNAFYTLELRRTRRH